MRYVLTLCLLILSLATPAQAQEKANYWLVEAPVAEGATNIERKRDDQLFMSHLTYEISIKNPDTLYGTYKKFYEDKGWKSFKEKFNEGFIGESPLTDKVWDGYNFNTRPDGTAEANFAASWTSPGNTFSLAVNLVLTDYDDTVFKGKVTVVTSPNPMMLSLETILMAHMHAISEPRDFFILVGVFGKDIQDLPKLDFTKVPEKYKNEKVILAYKKMAEDIKQKYKEFGQKYVDFEKIPAQ